MHATEPSSEATFSFSAEPAVAMTLAPCIVASWIAAVPTPEPAACTTTKSPGHTLPTRCRSWNAVSHVSGIPAAVVRLQPDGTRISKQTGMHTYSAYPPPLIIAMILSPGLHRHPEASREVARATIVPDTSSPKIWVTPGGTGYKPRRCNVSARLTAVACTFTKTSPSAGSGTGSICTLRRPSSATTARIIVGTLCCRHVML
mmetsp:Transcript_56819/g.166299  ORF Transcript_56819/g.166299 Transcript_56819/m.166299 type:complete len:202 (-) Transcript_56819:3-608(-)